MATLESSSGGAFYGITSHIEKNPIKTFGPIKPTICILGGAGYIGRNLVYYLTRNTDYNIIVADYFSRPSKAISTEVRKRFADLIKGYPVTVLDIDLINEWDGHYGEEVNIVINLAGVMPRRRIDTLNLTAHDGDDSSILTKNTMLTNNSVNRLNDSPNIHSYIFASSMSVELTPDSNYGQSKRISEDMIDAASRRSYGNNNCWSNRIIRLPNVIGRGFDRNCRPIAKTDILFNLGKAYKTNTTFYCPDFNTRRTYVDVRDIATMFGDVAIEILTGVNSGTPVMRAEWEYSFSETNHGIFMMLENNGIDANVHMAEMKDIPDTPPPSRTQMVSQRHKVTTKHNARDTFIEFFDVLDDIKFDL